MAGQLSEGHVTKAVLATVVGLVVLGPIVYGAAASGGGKAGRGLVSQAQHTRVNRVNDARDASARKVQAAQEALRLQLEASKAAEAKLSKAQGRTRKAEAALEAAEQAFAKRFPAELVADRPSLEEALERVAERLFLGAKTGVLGVRVQPIAAKRAFGLELELDAALSKEQRRGILRGLSAFRGVIRPEWVVQAKLGRKKSQSVFEIQPNYDPEEIRLFLELFFRGRAHSLPPPRRTSSRAAAKAITWRVGNDTDQRIEIRHYGARKGSFVIPAHGKHEQRLPPGVYMVSVSAPDDSSVVPFTGHYDFARGYTYQNRYVIRTQFR